MRWLFNDGSDADRQYASKVAAMVETCQVIVPALFIPEAANVISRAIKAGAINPAGSKELFDLIRMLDAVVIAPEMDVNEQIKTTCMRALEDGLLMRQFLT